MEQWYEKEQQVVERIKYIDAVQQGWNKEEHNIHMLGKSSLERMKWSIEYWDKISYEPHWEIQEQWDKWKKYWDKIKNSMKDIGLPELGTPNDFVDLCDIVESHTKQDSSWAEELAKVTNTAPRQVQWFIEHLIRARTVLQ